MNRVDIDPSYGECTGLKRKRTAHACEPCRQRKSRCNGARPICDVCYAMGFQCVYRQPARSSSAQIVQPETVTRLEHRLAHMEKMIQGSLTDNRVHSFEDVDGVEVPHLIGRHSGLGGRRKPDTVTTRFPDAFGLFPESSSGLDGLVSVVLIGEGYISHFGPTSCSTSFAYVSKAVGELTNLDSSLPTCDEDTVSEIKLASKPDLPHSPYSTLKSISTFGTTTNMSLLPPDDLHICLIERFFSNTGSLFPFIYKPVILRYAIGNRQDHLSAAQLCLLNMVLAFGAIYSSTGETVYQRLGSANVFFQKATALLPDIMLNAASLESVQALLITLQYVQGTCNLDQVWSLWTATIQAALQMGLYRRVYPERLTSVELETRKRTWWMCFIMDKICSVTFGHPPLVPITYMHIDLPIDVELKESHQMLETPIAPENSLNTSTAVLFVQISKLDLILGNTIEKVYQNNVESPIDFSFPDLLRRIFEIEAAIVQWKCELPSSLSLFQTPNIAGLSQKPTHPPKRIAVILSLRYHYVRSLLHRPILDWTLHRAGQGTAATSELLHDTQNQTAGLCIQSSLVSINLICQAVEEEGLLPVWWMSVYYVVTAALVFFEGFLVQHQLRRKSHPDRQTPIYLTSTLENATRILTKLGKGTALVNRCQELLSTMLKLARNFSTNDTCMNSPTLDLQVYSSAIPPFFTFENELFVPTEGELPTFSGLFSNLS